VREAWIVHAREQRARYASQMLPIVVEFGAASDAN
jgi:hypothetical protein